MSVFVNTALTHFLNVEINLHKVHYYIVCALALDSRSTHIYTFMASMLQANMCLHTKLMIQLNHCFWKILEPQLLSQLT